MIKPIVEFCISNVANGSQRALEQLEKDPNIDVLEYGCLGYCTKCAQTMFAIVNGDIVTGESADELVKNVYTHIEENEIF